MFVGLCGGAGEYRRKAGKEEFIMTKDQIIVALCAISAARAEELRSLSNPELPPDIVVRIQKRIADLEAARSFLMNIPAVDSSI